ncbi:hypothetical protein RD1_3191 [Roseobacter denitrificans OCh 114]|uniref:Uncharacterized protein n=1 Tax=Roseobacter denitrificans (strain ATCC 33942 / OCh 114) TaxID=375451 RepID=Q163Z7_ROSDO|nr:hypothetical protein RD1_3191 [Roseobacter denitrificans OCh 114]
MRKPPVARIKCRAAKIGGIVPYSSADRSRIAEIALGGILPGRVEPTKTPLLCVETPVSRPCFDR